VKARVSRSPIRGIPTRTYIPGGGGGRVPLSPLFGFVGFVGFVAVNANAGEVKVSNVSEYAEVHHIIKAIDKGVYVKVIIHRLYLSLL